MRTCDSPSRSSASRIAPMRPSIMSLGATTSQPARACTIACRQRTSTVSSFTTYALPAYQGARSSGRSRPSCPCVVNGSSATSQITPRSGHAALTARTARQTRLSGFVASSPSGVFRSASITGKTATAGMPAARASFAASTRRSTDRRETPGMDAIGLDDAWPSCTKSGQIRSAGVSTCSRVRRRDQASRRSRRIRVRG